MKFTCWYSGFSAAHLSIFAAALVLANGILLSDSQAKSDVPVPLSQYAGKWTGTGWGKRDSSAAREAVRCRMTVKSRKATRKLVFSGKCAATSRTFTLLGHLAHYPGTNKMTGRWVNPDGVGSMNIVGKRRSNILSFEFRAKDRKSGKKQMFRNRWILRGSQFSIHTDQLTPAQSTIGSITFNRKN
ncbi:MAG: hypothetical protein ABJN65_04450 [Parasphingorhabdus sp.]